MRPSPAAPSVSSSSQDPESSEVSAWDSEELHRHAECLELEELTAISANPSLLPTLNDLLLEVYTMLRPKPVDYEQRSSLVDVFNKMTNEIFGDGICCGVLPVVSARVPILNVIDRGTGIECDISVENKDGMTRSMVFKFISSPDERQTRHPPVLPAFSALLKYGSDSASVERTILLFKGFGSRNKESVAELFVSLMSKKGIMPFLSTLGTWCLGLCYYQWRVYGSMVSALAISKHHGSLKTWEKGVGNLSVEDFLDRSQNFARSVGKVEMQKICRCLRDCALNLSDFMRGKIDTSGFQKRAKHAVHHVEPHHHANATAATGLPTPAPAHFKIGWRRGYLFRR